MNALSKADRWQLRRSQVNHDWLTNQYGLLLQSAIDLVSGEFRDVKFEREAKLRILNGWDSRKGEVKNLIDSFELDISPKALAERLELSGLSEPTRQWIAWVGEVCWKVGDRSGQWVEVAEGALKLADDRFRALSEKLGHADCEDLGGLCSAERELTLFRDSCRALSEAISAFPRGSGFHGPK